MKLARVFRVLQADRRLTLLLGVTHFLVAAAHGLFDIAATALLIGELGPDALPQVYIGSALLLVFVGLVIIPVVDRLDRSKLFGGLLVVFSLVLLVQGPLAARAPALVYRALYILCYVMKGLLFLQFWLLAGDLLDLRQAKRLFPVLLGFSLVGGLTASIAASLVPRFAATSVLLTAAGLLLAAALVPIRMLGRGRRARPSVHKARAPLPAMIWERFRSDLKIASSSSLLRNLSFCLLLLALLAQVLDYLLGTAAHGAFEGEVDALTTFYAILNGGVLGLGALLQFFVANRIISAVGVTRAQLLAPLTFIMGFAVSGAVYLLSGSVMASAAFFVTVVGARALQKVLRISLVRTSTDLIYNAIPSERRGRAKALKEAGIEPLGVLAGGALLLLGSELPLEFVLGAALLLSVVFLASAARLKKDYLDSLVQVLKEKSRFRFAFPSVVMRRSQGRHEDPSVSGVRRALGNDEASVRLLAVEVASELKEPEAATLLVHRFRDEPDDEVRARMLAALGKMLHGRDETSTREALSDLDPQVRASGISSIAESGIFLPEKAPEAEDETKNGEPTGDEEQAPREARESETSLDGRRATFMELARSGQKRSLERLVHYLEDGDGATRHLASRALESCGEQAIDILTLALWSTDVEGRRYVIRALDRIGSSRARQALLPVLTLEAEEAYYDLLRIDALSRLGSTRPIALLEDSLRQRVEQARRNARQILRAVFMGEPGMRLILSNLTHPDRFVRSSAIEALEVRVDPGMLGGVLPLFEHESPRAIAEHGSAYFAMPERGPLDVLTELTRHRSAWIRACAVFALGQLGNRDLVSSLERLAEDEDELTRLNAVEALGRLGDAGNLPLLEKLRALEGGRLREYAETAIQSIRGRRTQSPSF